MRQEKHNVTLHGCRRISSKRQYGWTVHNRQLSILARPVHKSKRMHKHEQCLCVTCQCYPQSGEFCWCFCLGMLRVSLVLVLLACANAKHICVDTTYSSIAIDAHASAEQVWTAIALHAQQLHYSESDVSARGCRCTTSSHKAVGQPSLC